MMNICIEYTVVQDWLNVLGANSCIVTKYYVDIANNRRL